ncbi:MAG: MBOAT family protein, partial [Firmicutes bacterium]|nr:MBOAT family protein [Bacillota bacterium]
GGNRVKKARWVLNIMVVWFLTGFWHGADWSFIAWGLYFGLLLLVEKLFLGKVLLKTPAAVQHIWTMLLVLIGWAFFDAATFGEAVNRLGLMVGAGASSFAGPVALYYLRSYALPLLLGVLGSTPLPKRAAAFLLEKGRGLMTVLEPLGVGVLLLTVTAFLVDGSFNPFIYFRF